MLNKEIKEQKKRILVEDSSSSSMDIDTGLYPFTSSYHTTTGAVCTGLGIPEEAIETTIGVFSAVSIIEKRFLKRIKTFPTHMQSDEDPYDSIQKRLSSEYEIEQDEYAFGWTDLNLIRHADLVNNLSSMMLTHLDVLNDVDQIKVATKYTLDDDKDEKFCQRLPAKIDDWENMVPEFKVMPGWNSDISSCDDFSHLPTEAKSFVRKLEQLTKKEVQYVSVND